jgi:nucleotide-binding universal stress UspA family protein
MEDNLVTVAIHTYEKAQILKSVLELNGIESYIHNVNQILPVVSAGVRVRIKESDLPKALSVIEDMNNAEIIKEALNEKNEKKNHPILIPIDFSDYSIKACEFGFDLAHTLNAEAILLHAYFAPSFGAFPVGDVISYDMRQEEETIKFVIDKVNKDMEKLTREIKEKIANGAFPDVKFKHVLREGIPEEEIIRYSKKHKPSIIIMGTRGKNQKDMDLIGSVTAEIIERSRVPVLAIPEDSTMANFKHLRNIAFATNFGDKDLIAFERLMQLMKPFRFKMHFIHSEQKEDAWTEIKLKGIKEYFSKFYPGQEIEYHILPGNDILTVFDDFIHKNKIDIFSLTTHKRNIFTRLFNPSIARKMVFHADTPMLVFHA